MVVDFGFKYLTSFAVALTPFDLLASLWKAARELQTERDEDTFLNSNFILGLLIASVARVFLNQLIWSRFPNRSWNIFVIFGGLWVKGWWLCPVGVFQWDMFSSGGLLAADTAWCEAPVVWQKRCVTLLAVSLSGMYWFRFRSGVWELLLFKN